ncbi:hypothetical protein RDABS01_031490 [Bienertia sinuspersici]
MSKLMEKEPSEENVELMRGLDNRMCELELREEAFWHQRSRQNWIKYGNQNSRFFHTKANQRRERNSIDHIRDEAGNVYDDEDETTESICSAKDLLQEGVRKIIGDGASTKIWSDPWVPDMPNSMVQPLSNQNQENRPVSVYELVENGCWYEELLKGLFTEECIQAIKKIPLPRFPESDRWAWVLGKGGAFSVKSAYYRELFKVRLSNSAGPLYDHAVVWKNLWKAKVPPKVQIFGWKTLRNAIPVRE